MLVDELALQQLSGPPSGGVVSLFSNRLSLLATEIFSFATSGHQNSEGLGHNSKYDDWESPVGMLLMYIKFLYLTLFIILNLFIFFLLMFVLMISFFRQ